MEMAYREGGGLLLPTLATEEEAAANLGPFALMRDEYLRSSKPELRADLLAQGGAGEAPGRDGSPRGGDGGRPGGPRGEEQGVGRSGEGGGSGSVGGEDGRGGGSGPRSGGDEGRVRLEKQRGQEKTKTSRREAGDKPASRRSEAKPPERGQLAFSFDDGANEYPEQLATPLGRLRGNIAAIEALVAVEGEGRPPDAAEREALARYVGWGGLADAFDEESGKWAH